jgi:alpha-L-rhamnosidase-like protein
MANPGHVNYTNCFWETLNPDGTPGLGLGTSLCHGWAAGPMAELSSHVLGVNPAKPSFVEWVVKPITLRLGYARGKQHTERGDIVVDWRFDDAGLLRMNVTGPEGGLVYLPEPMPVSLKESSITVNGVVPTASDFPVVSNGDTFIEQRASGSECAERGVGGTIWSKPRAPPWTGCHHHPTCSTYNLIYSLKNSRSYKEYLTCR